MRYLDAVALAKLRNLRLGAKRLAPDSHLSGRHRSAVRGPSRDFAQHRAYVPGDEIKTLDWKVFARQERFYVREFQSEAALDAMVLLDASGSMAFSAQGRPEKWEIGCRLAMALSYLVLAGGDAAGLCIFDSAPREFLACRGSFGQLEILGAMLERRRPSSESRLADALAAVGARLRRRCLVVLVSDLLAEPEGVLAAIKGLRSRRHEVLMLQVLDPFERDFNYEGPSMFHGLEDGRELYCDATALAPAYRAAFARRQRLYEAGLAAADVSFMSFYTNRPWCEDLAWFLGRRSSSA
jgi:uncharacterized protein (DUF58 family)